MCSPAQCTDDTRWKLMILPTAPPAAMKGQISTRLPKAKTIVDVFADFMRYLFDSTKALFKASEPNGELRWNSVSDNIELVLTHPNGWGGPQQAQLRTAAIRAGIVPDTPLGRSSVHFVTEGEASFNFCATHTHAGRSLKVRRASLSWQMLLDTLVAGRAGFDHRCGWWNHRYQHLQSSQWQTVASRRVVRIKV